VRETCWIFTLFKKNFVNNSDKASFANGICMYICTLEFSIKFYVGIRFRSIFSIFQFTFFLFPFYSFLGSICIGYKYK